MAADWHCLAFRTVAVAAAAAAAATTVLVLVVLLLLLLLLLIFCRVTEKILLYLFLRSLIFACAAVADAAATVLLPVVVFCSPAESEKIPLYSFAAYSPLSSASRVRSLFPFCWSTSSLF